MVGIAGAAEAEQPFATPSGRAQVEAEIARATSGGGQSFEPDERYRRGGAQGQDQAASGLGEAGAEQTDAVPAARRAAGAGDGSDQQPGGERSRAQDLAI